MKPIGVACVQVNASNDMERNIANIRELVLKARDKDAVFITTPEAAVMIERGRDNILAKAYFEENHPGVAAFRELAIETDAWLLAGSFAVKVDGDRLANRSLLFGPAGNIMAKYDKVHMFDIDLPGGESYRESRVYRPGEEAVVCKAPWAAIGLTVCYDMRFPHLYRDLAQLGAEIITVPSAFTRTTGRAHWDILLKARAIETGCFIIAAAQCGTHAGGRDTYGHSIIIDPWGTTLAEAHEDTGIIIAHIELEKVREARTRIPSLHNDRSYSLVSESNVDIEAA